MSAPLFQPHNKTPLRLPPKKLLKGVDMSMLAILFSNSKSQGLQRTECTKRYRSHRMARPPAAATLFAKLKNKDEF